MNVSVRTEPTAYVAEVCVLNYVTAHEVTYCADTAASPRQESVDDSLAAIAHTQYSTADQPGNDSHHILQLLQLYLHSMRTSWPVQ